MSAMSYWLIESTAAELSRINDRIEQNPTDYLSYINPSERSAYPELVEACRRFLDYHEDYGYLLNTVDSEEEQ